jgi:uncharacterized alkaline shock family protein YloU
VERGGGSGLSSPLGRITIAPAVIAQVVAHTAGHCYGVVELAGGAKARVGRFLPGQRAHGVSVTATEDGVELELNVVVEYGLNLAEVAATVRSQVQYEVERLTGLRVAAVGVRIDDVRQSA